MRRWLGRLAAIGTLALLATMPGTVAPVSAQNGASPCADGEAVQDAASNPGLVSDCDALLSARDALAGDGTLNWSSAIGMELWDGITLGGSPLRVTALEWEYKGLSGRLAPELGSLAELRVLNLNGNDLHGAIPPQLADLSKLEELDLLSNELSGPIPAELGRLSSLRKLYLAYNDLTGTIPVELGGLSSLQELWLAYNDLTGPIPPELGDLGSLQDLFLSWNRLTGPIPPVLGKLANLQYLKLVENQLSGPIPPELGNLERLEYIGLSNNFGLSGPIPDELGNLSNLELLALGGNRLSGPIPRWLADLPNLKVLSLPENRLEGGPIPDWLGGMTQLESLNLGRNRLTGPIPDELSNLSNLQSLNLYDNRLTGPVPAWLGSLGELFTLGLGGNRLSGPIPPELGRLSNLTSLSLSSNRLTGPIPAELSGLSEIRWLSLDDNSLTGAIPPGFANLSKLESLGVNGNELSGCLPWLLARNPAVDVRHDDLPICDRPAPTVDEGEILFTNISDLVFGTFLQSATTYSVTVGDPVNGEVWRDGEWIGYRHDGSETTAGGYSYTISSGARTIAKVETINVRPVNDAPVTSPDAASVEEGDAVTIETASLLSNDTDADGDELVVTGVSDPVNGSVMLEGATVIYRHDGSETTSGSFSYTVSDGVESVTAVVTVDVRPVNDAPVASPDTAAVDEGDAVTIETSSLLRNDTDAEYDELVVIGVSDPVNGSVVLEGATVTYRHDGSETTSGSFSYTVSDGVESVTGVVTVDVTPVNDAPVASPDTAVVDEGDAVTIETSSLLRNDTDADGDELVVTGVSDPVNGSVMLEGATVIYRHDGSETTSGSFSYTVSDGVESDTAEVVVTVRPVDDPTPTPTATAQAVATAKPADDPTPTPTATAQVVATARPADDPTPTPTAMAQAVATARPADDPTPTPTAMAQAVATARPADDPTPTATATAQAVATATTRSADDPTPTPTVTVEGTVDAPSGDGFPAGLALALLIGVGLLAVAALLAVRWRIRRQSDAPGR